MTRTEIAYEIARTERRINAMTAREAVAREAVVEAVARASAALAVGGSATTALWVAANKGSELETAMAVLRTEREELAMLYVELAKTAEGGVAL